MMLFKVISVAALAILAGSFAVTAQTAGDFGGPAELPPADFAGQQFVDSKGCVFLRAGYGGTTSWVPRVTRERKPLCGYPPTVTAAAPEPAATEKAAVTAEPAAPKPAKPATKIAATAKPAPQAKARSIDPATYVAPRPVNLPAKPAQAHAVAQPQYQIVPSRPGKGKIGCFRSAPVPVVVRQRDGKLTVMCAPADGSRTGLRAAVLVPGTKAAVAPVAQTAPVAKRMVPVAKTAPITTQAPAAPSAQAARAARRDALARDRWLRDPPLFGGTGYAVAFSDAELLAARRAGITNPARP